MLSGESKRLNLSGAIDLGHSQLRGGGVDLEGIYLMPRSQRVIVNTYSRWEDRSRPGRVIGESWHEADNDEIAAYAREFDDERLAALLPELTDA
jgi:hypothetical protein